MTSFRALGVASSLACLAVLILTSSCSDSDDNKSPGPLTCANPGGTVNGAADSHCGSNATTIETASCKGSGTTSFAPSLHVAHHDAGHEEDAGASEYGPTLSNGEGDDDECKYHVKWAPASDTQVCANGDVYFNVTVSTKVDGAPARNVPVRPDSFLNDTHPSVPRTTSSSETSPGVYRVGPVRFDAAGNWTVRFHFHEECNDGEHSPHGHAAFYVSVP
ncbi:hypothetical protein LVJ94_46430 [Pendulispora rubella]|uniref:YtkA-like domain-containing protein n=1 Tax=Pendulispora rubella TaxID=2741070 RepID=A0ABZ2L066_9BACT